MEARYAVVAAYAGVMAVVLVAYGLARGEPAALGVGAALGLAAAAAGGLALSVEPPPLPGLRVYAAHATKLAASLAEEMGVAGAPLRGEPAGGGIIVYVGPGRPRGGGVGFAGGGPYIAFEASPGEIGVEGAAGLEEAVRASLVEALGLAGAVTVEEAAGGVYRIVLDSVDPGVAGLAGYPVNPISLYALAAAAYALGPVELRRLERLGDRVVVEVARR